MKEKNRMYVNRMCDFFMHLFAYIKKKQYICSGFPENEEKFVGCFLVFWINL